MILTLAWRNVWRNSRRTLINVVSIALGVWLTVTSVGLADYSYRQMIDDSARMGLGHVTIQPIDYLDAPSLKKTIAETATRQESIAAHRQTRAAATRITGQAMFASASRSIGGSFLAIDPKQESRDINIFLRSLVEGEAFTNSEVRAVLVGEVLAKNLKLSVGRKLILTAVDRHGEVVSELFRVCGIFRTGVVEIDGRMAVIPIERARQMLHYAPDEATMISVFVDDYRNADVVRDLLATVIPRDAASVLTWRQTQPELASLSDVDRGMNYLFLFLLGLLIAAGVLNTSLMSVLERRHEFGIMMAIGTRPGQLSAMILIEAASMGFVGLLAGAILCVPWAYYLIAVGLDMSSVMGEDYTAANVLIDPIWHITLYPGRMFAIAAMLFTLTLIAALYPAFTAARARPIESLRDAA
ncbi:MAG: ABC transporter permease [Deltaproteobacteria bacterium]|nr:ABC transporter permease [Deltaproteobacteria bacterium]